MTQDEEHKPEAVERKLTQAEAAKQLLAKRKQAQANGGQAAKHGKSPNQMMKSQNTKKINNQRKRTGV